MAFNFSSLIPNLIGGLGGALSGVGNAITGTTADAAIPTVTPEMTPDINLESTKLDGFTPMENTTGMANFSPKLQMDTKGSIVSNTIGGLGGSAGNLAASTNLNNTRTNLNAPGTEGTSNSMDWMSTIGTLGKLYETYKNDKRADASVNAQLKDRNNSRARSGKIAKQMTGDDNYKQSGSDYKYV